jgi:hypothetical protein
MGPLGYARVSMQDIVGKRIDLTNEVDLRNTSAGRPAPPGALVVPSGRPGAKGEGLLPADGVAGSYLTKKSNAEQDAQWSQHDHGSIRVSGTSRAVAASVGPSPVL